MSIEFEVQPPEADSARPRSWEQIWFDALTSPQVSTYERLSREPQATPGRAYIWILVTGLIGGTISVVLSSALNYVLGTSGIGDSAGMTAALQQDVTCICSQAILAVPRFMISIGVRHVIAKALGGTGKYSALAYLAATYTAPLILVSYLAGAVPYIGLCVTIPVLIYSLVLDTIAIKVVHEFDWGKAILSSVGIALLLVLVAIGTICILTLLGPSIGNVFSGIINDI